MLLLLGTMFGVKYKFARPPKASSFHQRRPAIHTVELWSIFEEPEMARESIKVIKAALDISPDGQEIVLRGVIDPSSLNQLQIGEYQRGVLPLSTISELKEAIKHGKVPDVDLSVRGSNYTERSGAFYISDPVFVVDGRQRVTAALELINGGGSPHLGATFHFGGTEEQERERFSTLNTRRSKVSPNVLLRNARHDHEGATLLYKMCESDNEFVLRGRVSWEQSMQRSHLITALTLCKVTGMLHSHIGPGRSNSMDEILPGIDAISENAGPNVFRANTRMFFDVVDQCWGIRSIAFKQSAIVLRLNFLSCLARVISRHPVFWKDTRMTIDADTIRKLRQFPIHDPSVVNLAGSSGKSRDILYALIVDHINSGRRKNKLIARDYEAPAELDEDAEEAVQ